MPQQKNGIYQSGASQLLFQEEGTCRHSPDRAIKVLVKHANVLLLLCDALQEKRALLSVMNID